MKRFVFHYCNIPKHIANHLLGKNHSFSHRIVVGIFIMALGVITSKIHTDIHLLHLFYDGLGYGIHGLGCTPLIELLVKIGSDESA